MLCKLPLHYTLCHKSVLQCEKFNTVVWSCCTHSINLMVTISLSCLKCWKVQRKYSLSPIKKSSAELKLVFKKKTKKKTKKTCQCMTCK